MLYSHAVKVVLDLVTETKVQVGQRFASHEVALAVSWSVYVPGATVPNMKDYDERQNIIQNIPVAGTTIQGVFAWEGFGSIEAMKKKFVVIEWKNEY